MFYTIEIDDTNKTTKSIIDFLRNLSKNTPGIHFIPTVEDKELLKQMKSSLKSGRVSKREIGKTIKDILSK